MRQGSSGGRSRRVLGGSYVTHALAVELGYEVGYGRGALRSRRGHTPHPGELALPGCPAPAGVYRPGGPPASPLYRALSDHIERFRGRYEEEFDGQQGRWRRVVGAVVGRFVECGVLEAGFARVRCEGCKAECLLASSCVPRAIASTQYDSIRAPIPIQFEHLFRSHSEHFLG